jgi:hypothetical protein
MVLDRLGLSRINGLAAAEEDEGPFNDRCGFSTIVVAAAAAAAEEEEEYDDIP